MTKRLLRLLRIVPLAVLFAGVAYAQTTGTIIGVVTDASTGKPVAGALVIATSPNLQGEQTAITDNGGNYRFSVLPPGEYKVAAQIEGYKPFERTDIRLSPDKTLRANLSVVPEAVQLEEQVVRTGAAPVVNVGSAEAGSVVSQEFMSTIPVGRGFEQVALVAPTARADTYGVSFAGAQSPENQYIVDGQNTTDPTYGTRFGGNITTIPSLRTNFLQELDVKTGNFSAEYGRATGGVLNAVVKSGSNEFHGSVFSNLSPNFWVQPKGEITGQAGNAIAYQQTPSEGSYNLDYGFELGGPILKDKLWFYGGFSPVVTKTYYQRWLRQNLDVATAGVCPSGTIEDPDGIPGVCRPVDPDGNVGDYRQEEISGTRQSLNTERTTYQWVGKLTWLLNENNSVTVSGWGAPSSVTALQGAFVGSNMYASPSTMFAYTDDSQNSVLARYSGKFLDKRLVATIEGGWYGSGSTPVDKTIDGFSQLNTQRVEWADYFNVANFGEGAASLCADTTIPEETRIARCPVYAYATGGAGYYADYTNNRYTGKAALSYLFDAYGSHNVKGGVDLEFLDYHIQKAYSGPGGAGAYLEYISNQFRAIRGYGYIPGPYQHVDEFGRVWTGANNRDNVVTGGSDSKSRTNSFAYYLQDSWQMPFNLTLNYGLRLEQQSMENVAYPGQGFDINDSWAPRVQGIWDFTGQGRGKLAGSWGRYYYAIPLDAGDRAFGAERQLSWRTVALPTGATTGCGGYTGTPSSTFDPNGVTYTGAAGCNLVVRVPPDTNTVFRQTGGATTPVDPNLSGAFVDMFGAQAEYEVLPDLSAGIDYQGRRQGNIIEDMSSNDGSSYFVANPSKESCFPDANSPTGQSCSHVVTAADPATGRSIVLAMPKPKRSYDGVTFKLTKNFSQNWLAQASYTYSYLRGNYAGPYRAEDNQLDPGITSEYDLAVLMTNKMGYLPGDQPHQLKLYGAYTFNFGPRFNVTAGGGYTGVSGTPVSVLGGGANDYGPSQGFIVPRGQGGRTPFTNQVDLRGVFEYVIKAPYKVSFAVDLFNVFNSQTVQLADENYTFDVVDPIVGTNCASGNYVGQGTAALQAACPDLPFLKTTDGHPVTVNPNWGEAQSSILAFQAPFNMRLSLAISF